MLKNLMLKDFIDELGSSSPAPGGGSAAALSAALSSALVSMVFNLTIGKKAYDEYDEKTRKLIEEQLGKAGELKFEFLDAIDKDADAFLSLMAAFKLPKNTEEEKSIRSINIQKGYKSAIEVPMQLALKSFTVYDYIYVAAKYGNKNAISDAGVAALLLQTAIEGAILNVMINLSSIKDEEFKSAVTSKMNYIKSEGIKKRDEILQIVYTKI
jgi:formiminotetrahydrofolate cyclodeaminase